MKTLQVLPLLCFSWVLVVTAEEVPIDKVTSIHVDISAVNASGGVVPVDGVTSSGQPDEASLQVFADSGYVAVIDMRGIEENRGMENERASVEAVGMEYILFPIVGRDDISLENARVLDGLLQDKDGPVLIHCGSGNRVGAVLALRRSLDGASKAEAIAHGKNAGMTGLETLVRERLDED